MKTLKIADRLSLPLDVVTQTLLVVGKRGSGKSNTAARLVEQFHRAGLPFVVLDPTDTWWGVKASADGAGPGLSDVYVFGGRKADLPLEAGGGALIADVLCEHRMSMVLSVKHLSGRARSAFMVAFAQTLFQKWAGGPLHVVLEEAHELAPQMSGGRGGGDDGDAAMLGAFKRLWKLGRASGIGGTAVTQRPASLSKDITTQSEILVAHRTIGPQDVKAVGEWIKYHGEQLGVLADLPSLPTGQAIVWAPEFPEGKPLGLVRAAVLRRETYDSASTPKVGETRVEPKQLAAVDLERLRTKMAATIEKAKADDPKTLRAEIADLRRQIARPTPPASSKSAADRPPDAPKTVEILTDADRELLRTTAAKLDEVMRELDEGADRAGRSFGHRVQTVLASLIESTAVDLEEIHARGRRQFAELLDGKRFGKVMEKLDRVSAAPAPPRGPVPVLQGRPIAPARLVTTRPTNGHASGTLPGPEQKILNAVAELEVLGLHPADKIQVGLLAGYTNTRSGGFSEPLGRLVATGHLVSPQPGKLAITEQGRAAAVVAAAPTTPDDMQARVLGKLTGPEQKLLRAIVGHYPHPVTKEDLGAECGYTNIRSGGFSEPLGRLNTLGIVRTPARGSVVAAPFLFLEA